MHRDDSLTHRPLAWRQVPYVFQFEPYYIARSGLPPFNSQFKGRGGNKAQHVYALFAAGYRFVVMPQVTAPSEPLHRWRGLESRLVESRPKAARWVLEGSAGWASPSARGLCGGDAAGNSTGLH
jgi:hypothetical protein